MILKINDRLRNRRVEWFTDFKLNLKYDSVGSSFSLAYFFDPDNHEHKEFSCVGHYHLVTLEDNDELVMTGQIVSNRFVDAPRKQLAVVTGYSLPGVLEDCEIPVGLALQSISLSLREIAEKFIKPFGLQMVVHSSAAALMDEKYDDTTAKETQSVKSYLSELASQKNIILSHDEKGRLVFTKALPNKKPIFHFEGGMPNVEMELVFNGQGIHSQIVAVAQAGVDDGDQAAQSDPVINPYSPIVFRPHVITQSSGNGNDTLSAAKNALARELKNIPLSISIQGWTLNGKIVRPGNTVTVTNKQIYLYEKSEWLIEEVDLLGNASAKTAVLKCVRPEVYNGQKPKYLWQGYNLH